jgi:hypothetical protein
MDTVKPKRQADDYENFSAPMIPFISLRLLIAGRGRPLKVS